MKQFTHRSLMIVLGIVVGLAAFGGLALAQEPVHWTYEGEEGPDHWGELSPDFATCSSGVEQSPIDIASSAPVNPANIAFSYSPSAVNILNNGHTIQVNYDAGSSMQVEGSTYNLLQFHFHAHSEHTIDGAASPLELHMVHQNDAGDLAVVGLMINEGAENAALAPVMDNLPAQESEASPVSGATVNIADALPADQGYYRYDGSLTTPPCSEGVSWLVMAQPIEMSADQIAAFTQIFDDNYRPVQPLNDRSFFDASTSDVSTSDATESDASAEAEPEALPVSGGVLFPVAGVLMGLGVLGIVTGAGLYLYRRKMMV